MSVTRSGRVYKERRAMADDEAGSHSVMEMMREQHQMMMEQQKA